MKNTQMKGNLLLLLTAMVWGGGFVAQSSGMAYVGPFTFQSVRSLLCPLVLAPLILTMDTAQKRSGTYTAPTAQTRRTQLIAGIVCGVLMTIAANLQQIGIQYTTTGKAGFITAMYILIVPLLGVFLKKKIPGKLWGCIVLAMVGLYFLSFSGGFESFNIGDIYVLACAMAFAFHITAVDLFADKVDGVRLSAMQFLVCGILSGIIALLFEAPTLSAIWAAAVPIAYAGIISCGIGYTLQIVGQKYTSPTMASLLMSLESVFAVVFGALLLREIPSPREALGCVLMFIAIIIPQLPDRK